MLTKLFFRCQTSKCTDKFLLKFSSSSAQSASLGILMSDTLKKFGSLHMIYFNNEWWSGRGEETQATTKH